MTTLKWMFLVFAVHGEEDIGVILCYFCSLQIQAKKKELYKSTK